MSQRIVFNTLDILETYRIRIIILFTSFRPFKQVLLAVNVLFYFKSAIQNI